MGEERLRTPRCAAGRGGGARVCIAAVRRSYGVVVDLAGEEGAASKEKGMGCACRSSVVWVISCAGGGKEGKRLFSLGGIC